MLEWKKYVEPYPRPSVPGGAIAVANYHSGRWWIELDVQVFTDGYWMELPPPPTGEERSNG
jgi:hypothetical protein